MAWETKVLKILDSQYDNDDKLKQTWAISRRVDEANNKKYARELQRTVYYTKNGEDKNFPITLTAADVNWILAHKDEIKSAMAPSPKPAEAPVQNEIEETPF